jgi:hypothetical protein
MAAGSGPPGQTCVIHHKTDDLLAEQHTVSDGQAVSPVEEGGHAWPMFELPSFSPG